MKRSFLDRFPLARPDAWLGAALLLFLAGLVFGASMANIQTDAIDYYAIVQRLVGDEPPIVPNLPFVEQRSPGYPLLSLPAYYLLKGATFWVETETVRASPPAAAAGEAPRPSEQALLPPQPLRFSQVFFKDFDLAPQGGLFRWRIIAAMLLTGFALFFAGLFISGRTLALLYPPPVGYSLPPLLAITSVVFLHNLVNTPAYATLTVFGVSAFFTWFWVRGWHSGAAVPQALAGLLAGLLVLTRLETVVIVAVLLAALALTRQWRFLRHFVLGGLPALALLLLYNATPVRQCAARRHPEGRHERADLRPVLRAGDASRPGIGYPVLVGADFPGDHRAAAQRTARAGRAGLGRAGVDHADRAACAGDVWLRRARHAGGERHHRHLSVRHGSDAQHDPFRRQSLRHPAGALCCTGAAQPTWTIIISFQELTMTTSNLQVVFGTGPLGRSVVNELVRRGQAVRVVSRSGTMAEAPQGVELRGRRPV